MKQQIDNDTKMAIAIANAEYRFNLATRISKMSEIGSNDYKTACLDIMGLIAADTFWSDAYCEREIEEDGE